MRLVAVSTGILLTVALGILPEPDSRGATPERRPNLTGQVMFDSDTPIEKATVFIYTAAPKVGPGILCPSCYADCVKRAVTDVQGKFAINELDPNLLFRILIIARNYTPRFVEKVDPAREPLEAYLDPRTLPDEPDQKIRGRVTNEQGDPIEGAVVSIRGVTRGETTQFGGNAGIDPLAVSDEQGEFTIAGTSPFEAVGVDVEARGFAKGIFQRLETGATRHDLKLSEGVSVKGRILGGDQPLPGIEVGISGAERSAEAYVGNWTVATGSDGRFLFSNLPANTAYQLYGKIASLGERGTITARLVKSAGNGSTLDVGDLKLQPGFRVAGRVVLTDGREIPEKTRILLGREDAWDSQQLELNDDGLFEFAGVPPETISLSARVRGYRLTTRNASLDPLNPYHLVGLLRGDKTNLLVELEPGTDMRRLPGDQLAVKQEPLHGAEPGDEYPDGIQIKGTVVDEHTGEPLEKFTVTDGREAQFQHGIAWLPSRKSEHRHGLFAHSFVKLPQAPGVLIEAEGYIPQAIGPVQASTNTTVRLKKGNGIEAVLLTPSGEPAPDVPVYLTDMSRNSVYVDNDLKVNEHVGEAARKTKTDAAGRFSFPPQIDPCSLIVLDESGFANAPVSEVAARKELRLQAWAKISGQLMIGAKRGTNESIRLSSAHIPYEAYPREFPALSIYLQTKTDENGRFEFARVPPMAVNVYHEPKVRDSQAGTIAVSQETKFDLHPGETKELVLGGKGRPVLGKLVVPGYNKAIEWRADAQSIELMLPDPKDLPSFRTLSSTFAEAFRTAQSDEERKAVQEKMKKEQAALALRSREFYRTEAGRAHHFARKRYALNFSPGGAFRIEDVPPGRYRMMIQLREGGGDQFNRFSAPMIATLIKEFEVPATGAERSDEPFDLGTLEMHADGVTNPGKSAALEKRPVEAKP